MELRKKGRDDQLLKRRNIVVEDEDAPFTDLGNRTQPGAGKLNLEEIVAGIRSDSPLLQLRATRSARQMLSKEQNPPIQQVVTAGLVPDLVTFLSSSYANVREPQTENRETNSSLQFEAAWALTNIASGSSEETNTVVKAGAIPYFVALLRSSEVSVSEQAVWALGNIAGDGPQMRDEVLRNNAADALIDLLAQDRTDGFVRNVAWTLSNLCRNKNPPPDFVHVQKCLPALSFLLSHADHEIKSDACWAFSYVTDGTNDKIEEVVSQGVVPKLVDILSVDDMALLTPCLRTLGNIVTGTDMQTQSVIDCGALTKMEPLLRHQKSNIQKEAAWMISNVTAGTQSQIQAVLNLNLLPALMDVLRHSDFKAQKEAAWAITNLTSGGSIEQIALVANLGILDVLCNLLTCRDAKVTLVLLDGISNILAVGKKIGQIDHVCHQIEECGGLDKIERLQGSSNEQVYRTALDIIEKYFSEDDESEDLAPDSNSERFKFEAESSTSTFSF